MTSTDDAPQARPEIAVLPDGIKKTPSYPMPVYLKFAPGGISFAGAVMQKQGGATTLAGGDASSPPSDLYDLATYSPVKLAPAAPGTAPGSGTPRSAATPASATRRNSPQNNNFTPDTIVYKAKVADDRLLAYITLFSGTSGDGTQPETAPIYLPSLSILANAVFGRLTGVSPASARSWADAMILQYFDAEDEDVGSPPPRTEEDIVQRKPAAVRVTSIGQSDNGIVGGDTTVVALLKRLLKEGEAQRAAASAGPGSSAFKPRPCGYVFKRGDIAWNCRTCQTDSTCVVCDKCFRNSNHEGHEVFFHRTTPGGCCDCGDAEAWKVDGCCPSHRPVMDTSDTEMAAEGGDPEEAVRMAIRGRQDGLEVLKNEPTALPPKLTAALGVVVGAAVQCLVGAVDGAGVGADPVQWKLRWTDEAARIWNGASQQEDYHASRNSIAASMAAAAAGISPPQRMTPHWKTPNDFLVEPESTSFPDNFSLHLRLHNDDVHTFDEVIDALHDPRQARRNQATDDPQSQSLVIQREAANEMTHHVDADGQVTVKTYESISSAMQGFRRLKSRGLHCAVVSSAQVDMELRARVLSSWLSEISSSHPAAAVIVVHALLQINGTQDLGRLGVWQEPRSIPSWVAPNETDELEACRRRFQAFPPHLATSYVTSDEAELLHKMAVHLNLAAFVELTGTDPAFYATVPYRLPSDRFRKSPHALWGTLPSMYNDPTPVPDKHPLLTLLVSGRWDSKTMTTKNSLSDTVYLVDTDLRKQQEADRITSTVFPHKLPGLYMISGVGMIRENEITANEPPLPNPMDFRHLLATSSFRAPMSPIILLLLLDPYPTKQLRAAIHSLFLSLLTDARFKCRFAAALGIAYRPLSTLFCAGVGTEADTPLGFTVQIFTAGSLVRALGSPPAIEKLLLPDEDDTMADQQSSIGVFTIPIALTVVRCIHTNLLGATKEVHMILNNMAAGNDNDSHENIQSANESLLPALTYVAGEHPLITWLPAAPDDGFLDSRSTRHKRLPHLLRDLEYVIETPGTAMRLLLPKQYPAYQGEPLSARSDDILTFCTIWSRLLRLAQGMDPQKRKISGGHVEYEQQRWLEAFGLSLNFAGTRDALAESPTNSSSAALAPVSEDGSHLLSIKEAMGNLMLALLREIKLWLYREGMLETGLPVPPGGAHGTSDLSRIEALQRSTLHVAASQLASSTSEGQSSSPTNVNNLALACATSVKMTEGQLDLIESALKLEGAQRQYKTTGLVKDGAPGQSASNSFASGALMGDWLRVPHSPLAGDSLSFHLPLHRALAKTISSLCSVVVPESIRSIDPRGWWKLPVLDETTVGAEANSAAGMLQHPLVPLIRPVLRSSNCRVVWSAGPECTSQEAQRRRARSRTVSANIAVAKIIHSLADHPIRCLAAAQQIERHLWARNGSSVAGMALNYSNAPLCRSFRDLDLTLVQMSAAGMSVGLGARRVFALLISRFSMDGYLCDPERRSGASGGGNGPYATGLGAWINPPRLQDPDHATVLSESFFATLCILVTELPAPPPVSSSDETWLRQGIRRELIHALVAEPRSHSTAMSAASVAVGRRDESDGSAGTSGGGGLFRDVFAHVLKEVGKQKNQGSRAASGPAFFELDALCCDEYDPTFFHLRRQEHQHAMDVVASLRKQKLNREKDKDTGADTSCFPLVCQPLKAHPRFLACRLMLHLAPMDAAIRRSLLFALFGGSWLPPSKPTTKKPRNDDADLPLNGEVEGISVSVSTESAGGDVPVMTFSRRAAQVGAMQSTPLPRRGSSFGEGESSPPFSAEVVSASSVSFLEVLQLLTLQVHTLEECALLHRVQPDLDEEARSLSSGLSINSYLGRLVHVPDSMLDVWALRPYPDGPLKSRGSGDKRGSILGLMISLYEHRADHGAAPSGGQDETGDGHGGARSLTASGLKWLLRFVNALVDGAPSVAAATKSATTGVPMTTKMASNPVEFSGTTSWTIDETVRKTVSGMLSDLPDLWPKPAEALAEKESSANEEKKERGKAAQQRMLDMMKKKQSAFVLSMGSSEGGNDNQESEAAETEEDLCIICRCDDADGENNGPLCYLAHLQRSRVAQLRACCEAVSKANDGVHSNELYQQFRVVGHMGCQVRETEAMDSSPVYCLPRGSIVSVSRSTISDDYDILSRRVFVRYEAMEIGKAVEGWASVQSSQGYVILCPLVSLCYENTRWGSTRPIMRQCGHVAHLKCVETHTLSLHQRAAGDQPYDGRFAANIDDGEFLCPLCKQLSNILLPRDGCVRLDQWSGTGEVDESGVGTRAKATNSLQQTFQDLMTRGSYLGPKDAEGFNEMGQKALADFGSHLLQAMTVPWERSFGSKKRKHRRWHPAIQRWDYEVEDEVYGSEEPATVGNVLRLLRQQLIVWASVGHSAAVAEAAVRGIEEVLPFGSFSKTDDPWPGYSEGKEKNPLALELSRTMTGAAGLLEVLMFEMLLQLKETKSGFDGTEASVVGQCLADILCGNSWILGLKDVDTGNVETTELNRLALWSQVTAFMAAMPSHVARDGMLSQRHEARSTAAEMWVSRGLGTKAALAGEPPVPLGIAALFKQSNIRPPEMEPRWGSMSPSTGDGVPTQIPFRPAVATAFLYTPLLAWDLVTLAGAVFSTILLNTSHVPPNSEDILNCAKLLIVGRLVQSLITPHGFDSIDGMEVDEEDDEGRWDPTEIQSQGEALSKLYSHCQARVKGGSLYAESSLLKGPSVSSPRNLFGGVSRAILPFARSVILMMRACDAAVKSRNKTRKKQRGSTLQSSGGSDSASERILESVLNGSETMTTTDGLLILKEMNGPMPSALLEKPGEWWRLVNRWLTAAIGLEQHHGSRGKSVLPVIFAHTEKHVQDASKEDQKMAAIDSTLAGQNGIKSFQRGQHAPPFGSIDESPNALGPVPDHNVYNEAAGPQAGPIRFFNDSVVEESDEELIEGMEMDEAQEIVDFADQVIAIAGGGTGSNDAEESAGELSSSGSEACESKNHETSYVFAGVSKSPIINYQPSLLAQQSIGPGKEGSFFEAASASLVMADLSHLGLIHRKNTPTFSLIRLPKSFVELYGIVNKVKGRDESSTMDEADDIGSSETAICLLTGAIMRSGSSRRSYHRTQRPPGACTLHARMNGSGIGIFFLVQKCTVLLMHNNKSAYSASLYVDEHGEEDPGLRRGRPLFLNDARYGALEQLWRQQGIPREVAQIRSTSDRVIRDNWY